MKRNKVGGQVNRIMLSRAPSVFPSKRHGQNKGSIVHVNRKAPDVNKESVQNDGDIKPKGDVE